MHKPIVKHTLNIFKFLTDKIPPLVPENFEQEAKEAYARCCENYDLSLPELENHIVLFGKGLWPYRKSFEEFYDIHENHLGDKFLLGVLPMELKKHYIEFKEYGGGFKELHHNSAVDFFSSDERNILYPSVMKIKEDIRRHTMQAVVTNDRYHYEKRIAWFQDILNDIEKRLDTLRLMADNEEDHPDLSEEIREQTKAFEQGLCLLGPAHHYNEICDAEEYFLGRKKDKKYSFV